MIRLIQRRLIIPRGDTGSFSIPILAGKNTGDVAVFTVFDLMTQKKLLEKTVTATNDTLTIEFNHNDTVNLPVGQFVWDIKYYANPVFADGKLVDGEEIDSYYAAFTLPVCEIRQTGDMMLMVNDAALPPDQLDILLATLNATIAAKNEAVTSAAEADTSATNAENSASAALASEQAALESQNAALASQQAAAASAQQALASAELATIKAEQIAADISNKADKSEIPTKVSDLTDDSGHYTKPASGIPASDLEETYVKFDNYATDTTAGVVKVNRTYGLQVAPNGTVIPLMATDQIIKQGNMAYYPIGAGKQHAAAFYGLAKAAGSDEKDSELPVGQYTNAAKAAIQQMLDVPSTADIPTVPTNVSAFTNDAGYLTEHQDISGKANVTDLAAVATSGSYEDLEDKPTIPDIQINGSSIVNNGVANIPYAETNSYGLVKILPTNTNCMVIQNGMMGVFAATTAQIKNGATDVQPITPRKQHGAVFYGLAKVAGVDLANEEVTVGTYPDSAKIAIQQMLGVPAASAIPTSVSQLTNDAGYLTAYTETDPTVPSWAKAAQKPTYTAAEVGAPTVQEMNTAIGNAIGNINSFDMAVVQALPTQDISTHTIYLVPKTGETNDVYDEYVYINNAWEMVGNTQIDLSNYVQKTDYATMFTPGVIQAVQMSEGTSSTYSGVALDTNHLLRIYPATETGIKNPFNKDYAPIVPKRQHVATFYGLAKAAGDTTQSQSDNAVGIYTTEAKAAIRSMIGAAASADLTVQDVQVNGTSVLSSGIANIPLASMNSIGVVSTEPDYGININNNGKLYLTSATSAQVKASTSIYKPVVPARQHESTFYGLAKAAGDTTQSQSDNAVGTYTDEAKAAIQQMLDVPSTSDIPDTSIYATKADTVLETTLSKGRKEGSTIGEGSFAFGSNIEASGANSFAIGEYATAKGEASYARGTYVFALGNSSSAEGSSTHALATSSHAEGGASTKSIKFTGEANATVYRINSFIPVGSIIPNTSAPNGAFSLVIHVEQIDDLWYATLNSTLNSESALAAARQTVFIGSALEPYSHTEGSNSIAIGQMQHVEGRNNYVDANYAHIVGNGFNSTQRSNAYALDWDGNGHYMGNIYVGANADSTGGTKVLCEADFATAQDIQNIINGGAGA